jgi:hypothetical protein
MLKYCYVQASVFPVFGRAFVPSDMQNCQHFAFAVSRGFWSCRSEARSSLQSRYRFAARLWVLYTTRRMVPFLPRPVVEAKARLMTCEVLEIASRVSSPLVIMSIVLRMPGGCEQEGP